MKELRVNAAVMNAGASMKDRPADGAGMEAGVNG
jgi:hypothetical protein